MTRPKRPAKVAKPRGKAKQLSTSQARADFASALLEAQKDLTLIGFDRYGRTQAALVPVEAIYMLAGEDKDIPPHVKDAIVYGAEQFVSTIPHRRGYFIPKPPARRPRRKKRG
jgi:hypothetical protein